MLSHVFGINHSTVLLVCNSFMFISGHIVDTDKAYAGFGRDGLFRATDVTVHDRRICTTCVEAHPHCEVDFWDLYDKYGVSFLYGNILNETKPHDLAVHSLYMSCWNYDLANDNRRKRSSILVTQTDSQRKRVSKSRSKRHTNQDINPEASGRLYINTLYFGAQYNNICSLETQYDQCLTNGFDGRWFLVECNLDYECSGLGVPRWLQECQKSSTFLHVEYQCVPDENIVYMNHNDISWQQTLTTVSGVPGYIISPNYPHYYETHSTFECYIRSAQQALFTFNVLDFHLEDALDSGCCGYDWLEFQDLIDNQIRNRTRFCGHHLPGKIIAFYAKTVRLEFQSDDGHCDRGFWLEYTAKVNENIIDTEIECNFFDAFSNYDLPLLPDSEEDYYQSPACDPDDTYDYFSSYLSSSTTPTLSGTEDVREMASSDEDNGLSTTLVGIIVGVSVAILLLLIVFIILLLFCIHRRKPKYMAEANNSIPAGNVNSSYYPSASNPSVSGSVQSNSNVSRQSRNDNYLQPVNNTRSNPSTDGVTHPYYLDLNRQPSGANYNESKYDYIDPAYNNENPTHVYQELTPTKTSN